MSYFFEHLFSAYCIVACVTAIHITYAITKIGGRPEAHYLDHTIISGLGGEFLHMREERQEGDLLLCILNIYFSSSSFSCIRTKCRYLAAQRGLDM